MTPTIYETHFHKEMDLNDLIKLQPFVSAHRPHDTPAYLLVTHKDRMMERETARIAGEWRHPACGEMDKMMDVITHQHQTHRSWMECKSDLTDDYFTSNPLFEG